MGLSKHGESLFLHFCAINLNVACLYTMEGVMRHHHCVVMACAAWFGWSMLTRHCWFIGRFPLKMESITCCCVWRKYKKLSVAEIALQGAVAEEKRFFVCKKSYHRGVDKLVVMPVFFAFPLVF